MAKRRKASRRLVAVRADGGCPAAEHSRGAGSANVANQIPSASDCANELAMVQPVVFNTVGTSGGIVLNVAGDYIAYGPSDKQLAATIKEISGLDKLSCAEGASWDPKLACLPGTRVKALSVIHAWSCLLDAQNVFWLNGVAGAGKSAIAHTIAQALHKDGLLVSSFFFDRNDASRNTPRLLFTTIARDIAVRYPAIAADISTALEDEPSLASAPLSRQFEAFIAGPLRRHMIDHPIVVVIDALDETISDDSDTTLLTILRDGASQLPPQLRILITSRPMWIIEQHLSGHEHITSYTMDIHSLDNRQDIAAYVDIQLRGDALRSKMGPSWPDEALIRDLKLLAEGLFIWIATICSYLRSAYNPRAKLDALLSKSMAQGLPASKKMDDLYASILEVCADWKDADFLKDYDLVMGAIMGAKRPLSLMALKALHGSSHPMELSADLLLERFRSVLVGFKTDHEPIRMLHVSFREFITDHANNAEHTRKFYISEKLHSRRLAALCLQTMVREFTTGHIYGTGYLALDDNDPPGISEVGGVSEQLLYSCEVWCDHISDVTEPSPIMTEHMRAFILDHIIVWMEVVASNSVFSGLLPALHWLKDHAPGIRELCDDESQSSALSSLSIRLVYAGRFEEALTANREAVVLCRALATERPTVHNAGLAKCLDSLSNRLSAVGQRDEALTAVQEAVGLRRALASERPDVFNADLATSLNNLCFRLSAVGQSEEAFTAVQEAVDLRRVLAIERPSMYNADLAASLDNVSHDLSAAGRTEEALAAIQEAVDLRRALASERPAVFNADLAQSLDNLSVDLSNVGRTEEAFAAVQEAVDLRRVLAIERPSVYNADLAASLNNISHDLSAVGRTEEALMAVQEAVDLHRALVAERPTVFNAGLAASLHKLSYNLSVVGRTEEALMASQEAVDLYRALAAERPAAFNADLAESLSNLSVELSTVGRTEEALTAIQEAVDLRRALASERPATFNADLAESLSYLSVDLSTVGRTGDALSVIQEEVDLRRTLASERPAVFNAGLAASLYKLSYSLSTVGRTEEALAAVQETVDLHRVLASEQPATFNADLAASLHKLSYSLSTIGRTEEGLMAVQEAVELRRALAEERPAVFNADLAESIHELSYNLSTVGRMDEGLVAVQEAVDLRRVLAVENPDGFNADLASSLNNLSRRLAAVGLMQEAFSAVQKAVGLRRALAAVRPTQYNRNLADSLRQLSKFLTKDGRRQKEAKS